MFCNYNGDLYRFKQPFLFSPLFLFKPALLNVNIGSRIITIRNRTHEYLLSIFVFIDNTFELYTFILYF